VLFIYFLPHTFAAYTVTLQHNLINLAS